MELFTYHPTVGYTFTPNQKHRIPHESGGYLVKTDSLGFRNSSEISADRKNVFVFGDSFTAGDGVSNGKRWSDLLGSHLDGFDVHNFGLSGSGTDQQYLAWSEFCRGYNPELVVIAVLVENIRRNDARYRIVATENGEQKLKAKPYFELDAAGQLVLKHNPVPRELREPDEVRAWEVDKGGRFFLGRRLVRNLGLRDSVQKLLHYQPLPEYRKPDAISWLRTRAILERWISEIEAPCVIVPIPIHQYIEGTADASDCQTRFDELSRDTGVPVIDPLPRLLDYDAAERRAFRFEEDVHFTEAGHKALADAVGPAIRDILGRAQ